MIRCWWCGLAALSLLGCGSSDSENSSNNGGGAGESTGGTGAGATGGTAGSTTTGGSSGAAGQSDPRPEGCRFEPVSVTSPGTNPMAAFVMSWVDQICTNLAPCCDAATFDGNACKNYYTPVLSGFANGDPEHFSYDPAAAQACLDGIHADLASCGALFGGECTNVARGLLRDGEVCTTGRECASGSCSSMVGDQKACGTGVRAALGQPCNESCMLDEYGAFFCFGQPNSPSLTRCYAEDGVYCDSNGAVLGPLDGSGATCAARHANGQSCTSYWQCASGVCNSGVCIPGSDVGGACPCKPNLVCSAGACQPGRGVGEACDYADNACAPGLLCNDVCECGGYYGSYVMPKTCEF